ncbi:MAG TPA: macro domain-containing protein [Gemmatimonadales bacterium]|nr:macro domain-containing protein [Gemmatimonadales bacterium]
MVDDLASVKVDAVVRPADQSLAPYSPAMARLDERAGPRFADQCRVSSSLKAGSAVVTGGGDLAAPFVLHVVIQDGELRAGREVVRRALVSAWQRAADWELGTIATPLVGAAPGELNLEEAATLLAETFPAAPKGCPSELHIVVDQDAERVLVEAIVRRIA